MSSDRPRYSAGNLTDPAWAALRRLKFANTSADIQPTLSTLVIAALAVAEAHADELAQALKDAK